MDRRRRRFFSEQECVTKNTLGEHGRLRRAQLVVQQAFDDFPTGGAREYIPPAAPCSRLGRWEIMRLSLRIF